MKQADHSGPPVALVTRHDSGLVVLKPPVVNWHANGFVVGKLTNWLLNAQRQAWQIQEPVGIVAQSFASGQFAAHLLLRRLKMGSLFVSAINPASGWQAFRAVHDFGCDRDVMDYLNRPLLTP